MSTPRSLSLTFHKSSYCGQGTCVEVAAPASGDEIVVRDSKDLRPDAPVLRFTPDEWRDFLRGAAAGEFDASALIARS